MAKKKLLISICTFLCAVTVFVGATVAYLSSISGPVENSFTIGQVRISLTETTGGSYQLIPGKVIKKDPKITVESGNEACWLFVKVQKTQHFDDYLACEMEEGWTLLGGFEGVYYREVVASPVSSEFKVLKNDAVTVRDNLTEERMSGITTPPAIDFTAYAVQSYGVDTAREAWNLILQENEA